MKSSVKHLILPLFTLLFFASSMACTVNKTTKKNQRPAWTKSEAKIENGYLTTVGVSEDFGSKSWQMAEMEAHRRMSLVLNFHIEGYRQSVKRVLSQLEHIEAELNRIEAMTTQIMNKTHITSKALLHDLQTVKGTDKKELRWYDPVNKRYYVKVQMDLNKADKKIIKKVVPNLPPKQKEDAVEALTSRSKAARERLNNKLKNMSWE